MAEIIFNGPEGRLEGRYHPAQEPNAPIALILHPHPQFGGTMNNKVVYNLFHIFVRRGFAVLRFNFRGVGRSQGVFDDGIGELSDAASALDWLQTINPNASSCWITGFSFGSWIGMQLLMRRPEIKGFITVAPPADKYDFSFLAPCPSSGLIVQGEADEIVEPAASEKLAMELQAKRAITIDYELIKGADHFFRDQLDEMTAVVENYLDKRFSE
ncbi:MAG: alpha/beta hydrolase [Sphingomonadales bacterium]